MPADVAVRSQELQYKPSASSTTIKSTVLASINTSSKPDAGSSKGTTTKPVGVNTLPAKPASSETIWDTQGFPPRSSIRAEIAAARDSSQPTRLGGNNENRPTLTVLGKRKAVPEDEVEHTKPPPLVCPSVKAGERCNTAAPPPSRQIKRRHVSQSQLLPVDGLPAYPLPPLPPILDARILKQVFTHISLFPKSKRTFEEPEENPARHYEKLEHVGDSLLGMVVTTWLHEIKPRLTAGTATRLRMHLVSNTTLSHLSGMYNLPQRMSADPLAVDDLRATTVVRAALLEAYIAGVYFSYPPHQRISHALPVLDKWLREMYAPLVGFFLPYMKKEWEQHYAACGAADNGMVIIMGEEEMTRLDEASKGMSLLVKVYCETAGRKLSFEEERYGTSLGLLFRTRCCVDGIALGDATRASKRSAKDVACWEAAKKLGLVNESESSGVGGGGGM